MQGQWLGRVEGEIGGALRLELEKRGDFLFGNAYLFYDRVHDLPGFKFQVRLSDQSPYTSEVQTIYLYPDGGVMTQDDRKIAEGRLQDRFETLPIPPNLIVEFERVADSLNLK